MQLTISLALLAISGLFVRSALEAARASPGFPLEQTLVFSLDPSLTALPETGTRGLYHAVLERTHTRFPAWSTRDSA